MDSCNLAEAFAERVREAPGREWSFHGLFGTFDAVGYVPDAPALAIRDGMQAAWAGLASEPGANPPYVSSPASSWPIYDIDDIRVVDFDDPIAVVDTHRAGRCAELRNLLTL